MKTKNALLTAIAIIGLAMLYTPATQAQTCDGSGKNFVDLNGDGFNDNAPDHDGDGIPNGLDEDYVKNPQDGNGYQNGRNPEADSTAQIQTRKRSNSQEFKRLQAMNGYMFQNQAHAEGGMYGSRNGLGDGSGGRMAGIRICNGTGSHGSQKRGGR